MKDSKSDDTQLHLVKQEFSRAKAYAAEYQEKTPISHLFNTRIRRVSGLLSDFEQGRVLDVGCGPAMIGNIFRGKPIEYYGVDVSGEMIKTGIETFGSDARFRFAIGSIKELAFPEASFDVVLCLGVLEYVLDGHTAIREVLRVLKPNGVFIVTMLNRSSPYRVWQRYVYGRKPRNLIAKVIGSTKRVKNDPGPKIHKRPKLKIYSERALRDLLTSEGLEVEDSLYYDFNVCLEPLDSRFPKVAILLSTKLEFLCRSTFKFLGTGFILKCRNR